jgi:transposase
VTGSEIITRRRKWKPAEKAALLAEVEAEGGKVVVVARRHGISESLLYNWRSARKATGPAMCATTAAVDFVPLGIFGPDPNGERQPQLAPPEHERPQHPRTGKGDAGMIEIALPNGARVCVDTSVNEKALSRVLRAMRNAI